MKFYYRGKLGKFWYDTKYWKISKGKLRYIGPIVDGKIVDKIPEGVTSCECMFLMNEQIKIGPEIPASVKSCVRMYALSSIEECPGIPEGVESCLDMFYCAVNLKKAPEIPSTAKNCEAMFYLSGIKNKPTIPSTVLNSQDIFYGVKCNA